VLVPVALDLRPSGWSDDEPTPWPVPTRRDLGHLRLAREALRTAGWAVLDLVPPEHADEPEAATRATAVLRGLGRPIRIFAERPLWRALASDPQRPSNSSGGFGAQEPTWTS
jgi:hypothetical protein